MDTKMNRDGCARGGPNRGSKSRRAIIKAQEQRNDRQVCSLQTHDNEHLMVSKRRPTSSHHP